MCEIGRLATVTVAPAGRIGSSAARIPAEVHQDETCSRFSQVRGEPATYLPLVGRRPSTGPPLRLDTENHTEFYSGQNASIWIKDPGIITEELGIAVGGVCKGDTRIVNTGQFDARVWTIV